ncbi:hypothetical protein [Mycolicibacterium houstonense]|uniref:hypothetical protein n=1 Tax=Mycolicibacterium houstonense TaxID=146021 RepID=UPI000A3F75E5|nr:hypothetical protein [Mycolicibacterium houstonense]
MPNGTSDRPGALDLDRLLHHEERRSEQWADLGHQEIANQYAQKMADESITKQLNPFESNAGAADGGYR